MIRQVVYLSSARAGTGDAEIAAILDAARAANGRNGLTGMLAAGGGVYLQVVEGPAEAVESLLTRLRADARHENLRVLQDGEAATRNFPGRLMGFRVLAPEAAGLIAAQLRVRAMTAAEIATALGNPAAVGLAQVALAA